MWHQELALCLGVGLLAFPLHARTTVRPDGESWRIDNGRIRVLADPQAGRFRVVDLVSRYEWRQPAAAGPAFRALKPTEDGVSFETEFRDTEGAALAVKVTLRVPGRTADLWVEADCADRQTPLERMAFLDPLLLETPEGVMAVADYSNGHIYPLGREPFRAVWLQGDRLNMPWVGICDLQRGMGYALILDTSDDAVVASLAYPVSGRQVRAPRVLWLGSRGKFAYPRRLLYRFAPRGGYVALAKAYRARAQEQGLLVTLWAKARRNRNVLRLFGAVDVWGAPPDFVQQAEAAGVRGMILHGTSSRAHMERANELGNLTSEYDNYTDIQPLAAGGEPDAQHDRLPENAVLQANGERMKAWLTYDKKTQFMKRCPAVWLAAAKLVIPKALAAHPFLARFIDVTTAEALYECFDPEHPLTRADKRRCGEQLLNYVRSLGLVVGGEHGIWWAVPYVDYFEGMMSSYQFAWPAGHLIRPKDRTEKFSGPYGADTWENYETWGLGHEYRVPLWELVFHDCVVTTWYWGDATDWLQQVDPAHAARKDAFNLLYGTIPLLWANPAGSWQTNRELFLRSCRNTSQFHKAVAGAEMLSHRFETSDRAVQRTRFANGAQVVVNFGPTPRSVWIAGHRRLLPQYGFAAHGPRSAQTLELVKGKPVTSLLWEGCPRILPAPSPTFPRRPF